MRWPPSPRPMQSSWGRGWTPYQTSNQAHLAYHERNRVLGRLARADSHARVCYRNLATPWFDYLFASVDELTALLDGTAWALDRCETAGATYLAFIRLRRQALSDDSLSRPRWSSAAD